MLVAAAKAALQLQEGSRCNGITPAEAAEMIQVGVASTPSRYAVELLMLLRDTKRSSRRLQLPTLMGQWHALIGCYGRHRRPVARSY